MNTAGKVAEMKRKHPEAYCSEPRCLWRTDNKYCPRHAALAEMRAKLNDPKSERETEYDLIMNYWPGDTTAIAEEQGNGNNFEQQ